MTRYTLFQLSQPHDLLWSLAHCTVARHPLPDLLLLLRGAPVLRGRRHALPSPHRRVLQRHSQDGGKHCGLFKRGCYRVRQEEPALDVVYRVRRNLFSLICPISFFEKCGCDSASPCADGQKSVYMNCRSYTQFPPTCGGNLRLDSPHS